MSITGSETKLEKALDRALRELETHEVDSDKYAAVLDRVAKLHKLKEEEKSSARVKPDTLVHAGANLLGILMIIRHENINVITSRAMSLLPIRTK